MEEITCTHCEQTKRWAFVQAISGGKKKFYCLECITNLRELFNELRLDKFFWQLIPFQGKGVGHEPEPAE